MFSVEFMEQLKLGEPQMSIIVGDGDVRPTISVKIMYDEYCKSEDLDMTLENWETIILKSLENLPINTLSPDNIDYEKLIRENTIPVLAKIDSYDKENIVSKTYHGMKLIYRTRIQTSENEKGSFVVEKSFLEKYNISEEELNEIAMKNLEKVNFICARISDIFGVYNLSDMSVVTSEDKYMGANVLLLPDKLKEISKEYFDSSNFVILPSSIHEIMVIPDYGNRFTENDFEYFNNMVNEVNTMSDCIESNEILATRAYYFSVDTKELKEL